MKLRVIIGEKEPGFIYSLLKERVDGTDFEIAAVTADSKELEMAIDTVPFDILFAEMQVTEPLGRDFLKRKKDEHVRADFIVISETENFRDAYTAIKCGVSDLLIKPLTKDTVFTALWGAMSRQFRKLSHQNDSDSALRSFLVANMDNVCSQNPSRETMNSVYCTRFEEGSYQCAFIKLDCSHPNLEEFLLSCPRYEKAIMRIALAELSEHCKDLLFETRFDGVMIYMNYPKEKETLIREILAKLQPKLQSEAHFPYGILTSICVSDIRYSASDLSILKHHAFSLIWVRMVKGTNGVLFYDQHKTLTAEETQRIRQVREQLESASKRLDFDAFRQAINIAFSWRTHVLMHPEVRSLIKEAINNFFIINEEAVRLVLGPDVKNQLDERLKLALTRSEYQEILLSRFEKIMGYIKENASKQNLIARQAEQYVMEHYNERISVDEIAARLLLSPSYFSTVYKAFTGMNFTDFIVSYRVKIAKNLLANTRMSIGEIADTIGYSDARYFSQVFRKATDQKPTEYRKSHLG